MCHASTRTIAAQVYVDGDVAIRICVDEPCAVNGVREELGTGLLAVPGGRLRMTTAGWLEDDVLELRPGSYDVTVHGDEVEDPAVVVVVVVLSRLPDF